MGNSIERKSSVFKQSISGRPRDPEAEARLSRFRRACSDSLEPSLRQPRSFFTENPVISGAMIGAGVTGTAFVLGRFKFVARPVVLGLSATGFFAWIATKRQVLALEKDVLAAEAGKSVQVLGLFTGDPRHFD